MDYYFKIVMNNGKEYIVRNKDGDIKKFMERLCEPRSFSEYDLAKPTNKQITINTVLIRGDDVSSVEYAS